MSILLGLDRTASAPVSAAIYPSNGSSSPAWSVDLGVNSDVNSVAVDAAGDWYLGGTLSGGQTTRKYGPGGLLWERNHGATVWCLDLDDAGNLYIGGDASGSNSIRKYSPSGSLLWSEEAQFLVFGIAAGPFNRIMTAGFGFGGQYALQKHNGATGNRESFKSTSTGRRVIFDSDSGFFYAGTATDVWKFDVNFLNGWTRNYNVSAALAIAVATNGTTYTSDGAILNAHDSSGVLQWSIDHGALIWDAVVEENGDVLIAGVRNSTDGASVRRLSSAGIEVWSLDVGTTAFSIAIVADLPIVTAAPGMPFPVALAVPYCANVIRFHSPALALPIAFAAPSVSEQRPPDTALLPGSPIYRLYLVDGDGLMQLPFASIQCRRRLGSSTWMMARVPVWTPLLESAISGMVGAEMLVYSGLSTDHDEVIGEFLRAVLTAVNPVRAAGSAYCDLTGRVQTPSYVQSTRALRGVQSRGRDVRGRPIARCAVDALMRPNDIVFDGDGSWVVGSISYRIAPASAWMDVEGVVVDG